MAIASREPYCRWYQRSAWPLGASIKAPFGEGIVYAAVFLQLIPDADTRLLGVVARVGAIVVLNSIVGSWLAARGRSWAVTGVSFLGTGAVNLIALLSLQLFTGRRTSGIYGGLLTFFLLGLLTLIGTLYDRHRGQRIESYVTPSAASRAAR